MELAFDHVAIAVPSLDDALPFYELLTGAPGSPPERVETQAVEAIFLGSHGGRLELIQPTRADSPVGRFLERRGPGLHHIAYRVPDLALALQQLDRAGVELIDREPRVGAHGRRIAFLHPRAANGVLIELIEG